jgi:hypothetical protein
MHPVIHITAQPSSCVVFTLTATRADMVLTASRDKGETVMKTIVSVAIALSVLAGIASSASALDTQKFWQDHATSGER